ncbi:MAG TPA: hypothetical protein VJ508_01905 [Saprospiraceae bacterium]|nr:hypothetical protein [Saprospiraceae bacterium]
MTELHQQLQDSIRELEQIRKVKAHIVELQNRLNTEVAALAEMEKTLTKEQRDVEALEKEGLTSMFRKFLGDREEKLDKERAEYTKASLRYNELYKSVELIRYELDLMTRKEQNEETVKNRIEVQLKMREEEIQQLDPRTGAELRGLHDQADRLQKYSVEVAEAFQAGSEALDLVRRSEYFLHQAQGFGQRDMWSRGYGTGYMKHQAIDQARDMAFQSRHALIRFANELKDVYKDLNLQVNMDIEQFNRFGDVFFDNLISDYLVQQKINKSLANVSATRQQVETILQQLEQEKGNIQSKQDQLDKQRREVILKAE